MGDQFINSDQKKHRTRHSGRKAEKKAVKENQHQNQELSAKQRNPKAFAINSAIRAERQFRRKQDIGTKKQHVPLVDRTPIEPPPILIAVVGPPKVGKSTLIMNLIKLFTKSPLSDCKGPVTIVTGRKRRITLIECNNDINSMIDLAKVADLVLLLIDASFGFEMEVFEFLNICQVHGMPRVMGVLTHLDMIKNNKLLKNTKKSLKHRFWTEVYPGAKLFYLSGILHGEYLRNEIKNLGRFISIMKFRPLTWRTTHSYILSDRYEDITNLELVRQNPKCNRKLCLYGYVRGVPLNKNSHVHIPGLGDSKIAEMTYLPDPCPLPDVIKKRALVEKEKMIYAPFSGVGHIVYDKDAIYVELGGSHSHNKRDQNDESTNIFENLIDTKETLDVKMTHSELQLFTNSTKITGFDVENDFLMENKESNSNKKLNIGNDDDITLSNEVETLQKGSKHEKIIEFSGRMRRKVIFNNDDGQDENGDDKDSCESSEFEDTIDENRTNSIKTNNQCEEISEYESYDETEESDIEEPEVEWKSNLEEKAKISYLDSLKSQKNLMKIIYGVFDNKSSLYTNKEEEGSDDDAEELGGLFKIVSRDNLKKKEKETLNALETSLHTCWNCEIKDYLNPENKTQLLNSFVTGKWKESEDAEELLKLDDMEVNDTDSEIFGDFEDCETGEKFIDQSNKSQKEYNNPQKRKGNDTPRDELNSKTLMEKKLKLREKFDAEYDNSDRTFYDDLKMSAEKQAQLNKSVFENMDDDLRVQLEGYRPGMYVRLEFDNIPSEFVTYFDATYPLIVGALNMGEENIGYVNVKLKKHRWYKKVLKANDPLVISLGWRRFQTLPLYSKLEDNLTFRYLKYTPEHLACNAHFWGPITPQGTGCLALQPNSNFDGKQGFKIVATGAVQELDKSAQIMKKLKLIGYPSKIYKKTAFIKGMFNTALEVAKFEGAKIKTVSGIRGQIKKAATKPQGYFRATFEDKIQLSDIVFCRTWYKVDVSQFYVPSTTLLEPPEQKTTCLGIRTVGKLKRDNAIKNQSQVDSLYTEIVREPKVFKPLVIPRKLQRTLPYKDKPKHGVRPQEMKQSMKRIAVVKEPHEKEVDNVMKMIKTVYEHKQEQMKIQTKARLAKHRELIEAIENKKHKKLQQQKKQIFRAKSKAQLRHKE